MFKNVASWRPQDILYIIDQGPLLLIGFSFNPRMDK